MKIYTPASSKSSPNGHLSNALSDYDLNQELDKRRSLKQFPMHIFPPEIQPLLSALHHKMEGENSFIGLTTLCVAGSAIGSAMRARLSKTMEVPLTIWGAIVGLSSSGKSMVQGILMGPVFKKQREFNENYFRDVIQHSADEPEIIRKVITVSDITIEALTRDVMMHNEKGIIKYHDELLTWLDGMDRKKGDTTEQTFWTETWNAKTDYMQQRVGNRIFIIKRENMFASVLGGTQPGLLGRFFDKGKVEQGFTYRILFAHAETNKMIAPCATYELPDDFLGAYSTMIYRMYDELQVSNTQLPYVAICDANARKIYEEWQQKYKKSINLNVGESPAEHEIRAGFFGKAREYALRFSLILKVMHRSFDGDSPMRTNSIEGEWMERGIEAAEYFYEAGWEAYCIYKRRTTIPVEILQFATKLKMCGYNQAELAKLENCSPANICKKYKKYVADYPTAFAAKNT